MHDSFTATILYTHVHCYMYTVNGISILSHVLIHEHVQYVLYFSVATFLPISDLAVGFTQSTYTFSEDSGRAQVCMELTQGQLGTNITLQVHTTDGTAQGIYVHNVHKYCTCTCTVLMCV